MCRKLTAFLTLLMAMAVAASANTLVYYKPGDQVADFSLELTDGGEFVLSENAGKIVVVDLWATWCPSCVNYSLPALSFIQDAYPDDVTVVAVNCGDPAADVKAFADDNGYDFPVAIDEELNILYNYFPTSGIPYTVFIDAEGRLYTTSLGGGDGMEQHYAEIIDEMLDAQ